MSIDRRVKEHAILKGGIMKMFTSKLIMLLVAASIALTGSAFAQHPREYPNEMATQHILMIPDLTEKQEAQIRELRTAYMKATLPLKNQLIEKEVRLNTLSTGEKANMKEINNIIEEIGTLKTAIMKKQAAHRQEIRTLLTEEQRLVFDAHPHPRPHPQYHGWLMP